MATLITKNSSTASSIPTAVQLVQGELAVNVTDKRLFTENSAGAVVELGTNPSSVTTGSATITGGTVNNTVIGATTAVAGTFTALTATGTTSLAAVDLTGTVAGGGNQLNNVVIGAITPLAGSFTTLGIKNASSAGVITLAAPITATNRTITLPDATGTVLTTATAANFPAGSVRQVVSGVLSSSFTTTSSSDVDTGLSATITPTSSTSKILVLVSTMLEATATGGGNCYVYQKLWRGAVSSGTLIHNGYAITGAQNTDIRGVGSVSLLDSPATIAAVTYRISLNSSVAGTNVKMNATTSPSTITLIEVSA